MDALAAIRAMSEESGVGHVEASERAGRSPFYVSSLLSRGSTPRADVLATLASAYGYRLVLEPLGAGEPLPIDPVIRKPKSAGGE